LNDGKVRVVGLWDLSRTTLVALFSAYAVAQQCMPCVKLEDPQIADSSSANTVTHQWRPGSHRRTCQPSCGSPRNA